MFILVSIFSHINNISFELSFRGIFSSTFEKKETWVVGSWNSRSEIISRKNVSMFRYKFNIQFVYKYTEGRRRKSRGGRKGCSLQFPPAHMYLGKCQKRLQATSLLSL